METSCWKYYYNQGGVRMAAVTKPIVVMKRYELKYLLTPEQTAYFTKAIEGHMVMDHFGLTMPS